MKTTLPFALVAAAAVAAPVHAYPVQLRSTVPHKAQPLYNGNLGPGGSGGSGGGGGSCTGGGGGGNCLYYHGGKVIQNVKLFAVYWGMNAGNGTPDQYDKFYGGMAQSAYFDWLREYNTPTPDSPSGPMQKVGRGQSIGHYIDPNPPTSTELQESDIQTWLSGLVKGGKIPAPDDNTLYVTYYPSGVNITDPGGKKSCSYFCAYHSGFDDSVSGKRIRYAVMPDQSGSCAGGCGGAPDVFSNSCSVVSHEIQEAVSDPDVWAGGQTDLGWYDDANGEDGDICNAMQSQISTPNGMYTVQQIWSQKQGACVSSDSTVTVADFALAIDNNAPKAALGGTATAKVTATPVGTATAMLNVTATGLPMGVTAAFAPSSLMSNASTVVTFTVPSGTMPGMYPFTITANTALPDNVIHSVTGTLNVVMPPPPDMAMPPPDLSQPSGGGNGGTGGGGNGGGTGGNGQNGGNGFTGGHSGCSIGGSTATSGVWLLGLLGLVAFLSRRRRA
jgi:MYXO-CTERM domain-containing protein